MCFQDPILRETQRDWKAWEMKAFNVRTDSEIFCGKMSADADSDGGASVRLERSAITRWGCYHLRLRVGFGIFLVVGAKDRVR